MYTTVNTKHVRNCDVRNRDVRNCARPLESENCVVRRIHKIDRNFAYMLWQL